MKIGVRLGSIYFLLIALFGAILLSTGRTFTRLTRESNVLIEKDLALLQKYAKLRPLIDDAIQNARFAAVDGKALERSRLARENTARILDEIKAGAHPDEQEDIATLSSHWSEVSVSLERLERAPAQVNVLFRQEVLPVLTALGQDINRLELKKNDVSRRRIEEIQRTVDLTLLLRDGFMGIVLLTTLLLIYVLRRYILSPLKRLGSATEVVARGNLGHNVRVETNDELGELARRFNEMTARLAQSEKMKREFLSMVSHDMRTPLTLIRLYASRLQDGRKVDNAESQRKALEIIGNETERLQFLVDDLLDTARAEAGIFRIEPCHTEMESTLSALLNPFLHEAEKRGISFSYDFSSLPSAVLDGKRVGQALRNLVTNAFKFTPQGGKVSVEGFMENGDIVLEVCDTGPGISEEEIPKIFTRFYQVPKVVSGPGSMGLGLAIVREIAKAHGGDVEVKSTVGLGTTFTIRLPYNAAGLERTLVQKGFA